MRMIKSHVSNEQSGELVLSCQARGRKWEGHDDSGIVALSPHSTQPPHTHKHTHRQQTTSQSGLRATIFAWAAQLSTAMTRFTILSFYLHTITPAPHHMGVAWSRGHSWPQGKGCLHWSKLTLLGDQVLVMQYTIQQQRTISCHHTNGLQENNKI